MATKVQIFYSETPGAVPTTLLAGELGVNIADKMLWVGKEDGSIELIASPDSEIIQYELPPATVTALGGLFSSKAPPGGYVSGLDESGNLLFEQLPKPDPFVLTPPTATALGGVYAGLAPDGEYVAGIDETGALVTAPIPETDLSGYLPLAGGTMTGPITLMEGAPSLVWGAAWIGSDGTNVSVVSEDNYLTVKPNEIIAGSAVTLPGDPVNPQEAVTKAYVDGNLTRVNYVLPPAGAELGGVVSSMGGPQEFVTGVDETGTIHFGLVDIPEPYVLPPAGVELGGVYAGLAAPGEVVIGVDDTGALVYGPDQAPQYQLPPATVAALGGVYAASAPADKFVSGVDETGNLTFTDIPVYSGPGEYVLPVALPDTLGGVKATENPGGQFVMGIDAAGALVYGAPDLTGYLPLAGGTMTGTIKVPDGINALQTASGFNMIGDVAGLTVRSGTTNLWAYGPTLLTAYKPIQLPGDPTANLQAATKQYVDSKVVAPYVLPPATVTALGGVKATANPGGQFVTGVMADGSLSYAAVSAYVLPPPKAMELGGVLASYEQDGKYVSAINEDGTVTLRDLPAASTPYVLPAATATVLGGVKIGSGITVAADGTISTSASGSYLPLAGGTMTGDIVFPSNGATGLKFGTAATRMELKGGVNQVYITYGANNVMWFGSAQVQAYVPILLPADPTNALHAATKQYVDSKIPAGGTAYLPLAGGTLTGALTLPAAMTSGTYHATHKAYVDQQDALALPKTGGTLTGALYLPSTAPVSTTQAVTKAYVDGLSDGKVDVAGDTMSGNLYLPSAAPTSATQATHKSYVDSVVTPKLDKAGGTMTGALYLPTATPVSATQAVHKQYVDDAFSNLGNTYLRTAGGAMTGPLRFTATANPSTYNGVDVYLYYSTDGKMRMQLPSGRNAFAIDNASGVMSFTYLPTCSAQPSTDTQLANKAYVDSKSYTLPTASASVLGGVKVGAGLSIDPSTGVLSAASGNYVPTTGGTMTGFLTLSGNPTMAMHAIPKQYADATYAPKVAFDAMLAEIDAMKAEIATLKGAA